MKNIKLTLFFLLRRFWQRYTLQLHIAVFQGLLTQVFTGEEQSRRPQLHPTMSRVLPYLSTIRHSMVRWKKSSSVRLLKGKSANLILHYIEQFGSRLKICNKPFLKIFCRSRDTNCHTSSLPSDVIAHEPINRRAHTGRDVYWFMCDDVRGQGRCVTICISASTEYFQKRFVTYF